MRLSERPLLLNLFPGCGCIRRYMPSVKGRMLNYYKLLCIFMNYDFKVGQHI